MKYPTPRALRALLLPEGALFLGRPGHEKPATACLAAAGCFVSSRPALVRAAGGRRRMWRAAADVSCLGADHAASAVSCSVASAPALMWRLTALSTAWNEAVTMSRSIPTPKPVPESPTRSST